MFNQQICPKWSIDYLQSGLIRDNQQRGECNRERSSQPPVRTALRSCCYWFLTLVVARTWFLITSDFDFWFISCCPLKEFAAHRKSQSMKFPSSLKCTVDWISSFLFFIVWLILVSCFFSFCFRRLGNMSYFCSIVAIWFYFSLSFFFLFFVLFCPPGICPL